MSTDSNPTATAAQTAAPTTGSTGALALPATPALNGPLIYDELTPAEKKLADAAAATVAIADALKVVDFADKEQKDLVTVARQLTERTKTMDTGKVGENSLALKKRYEQLGIGSLREGTMTRALRAIPLVGRYVDPLKGFYEREQSIAKHVDAIFAAQVEEEQALRAHFAVVEALQLKNMEAFRALSIQIGAAEQALKQAKALALKKAEEYKDSKDPAKTRELRLMVKGLELLHHKITTLKTARFEALNLATIMDVQLEGLVSLIGMIKNSAGVMRQVWENQIAHAITTYKMSKAATMLQENRDFVNQLMTANVEDLAEVASRIQQELAAGVVDIGVLEAVAQRTTMLQDEIMAKSVEIQKGLDEQGKHIDALVNQVQESTKKNAEVIKALSVE